MKNITTKRTGFNTKIFVDGVHVGEAFKFTSAKGFGLRLKGVYWRRGEPNTRGGSSTVGSPRLKDAVQKARDYLSQSVPAYCRGSGARGEEEGGVT